MRRKARPQLAESPPPGKGTRSWLVRLALFSIVALIPSWLIADWWTVLPDDAEAVYVGRATCLECHTKEYQRWEGSHHDLAMDLATEATVLGDFNDATLDHFGITSRMHRRDDKFFVNTEGPDGEMHDYQIKYVFGVTPLQQYLVEFDRSTEMEEHENARLQVLRITWDTKLQRWFYLAPPDVPDKLAPDDPLHWTGAAQNWNHMCADCHSTNLQKNFDVATKTYRTTFSEIDVSCEACHGPGSLHVDLAKSRSLFWDRKRHYALKELKTTNSEPEIATCAACHSRRTVVSNCNGAQAGYYDCYDNALLRPETYYADGQILDEVYVFGSFLQSKMYHKGVRCTDCHDPHSVTLRHEGNRVCTSCHQHPAAKYDTVAHHNHPAGSSGASCVECHMPATPFMDVDFRRDHSLRVPRPDLSVKWQTPNACTGCHIDAQRLPSDSALELTDYSKWLAAARDGNENVAAELQRLDEWAADWCEKWYEKRDAPHFADALAAAWQGDQDADAPLVEVIQSREFPAIVRASALWQLYLQSPSMAQPLAAKLIGHRHPQLRAVSIRCLQSIDNVEQAISLVMPRLSDSVRLVRTEAAAFLAGVPRDRLSLENQRAFDVALQEYRESLLLNNDLAGAHQALGMLAERLGQPQQAKAAYLAAIHVQPGVAGSRGRLADLLERTNDREDARRLRGEELELLKRDAMLLPEHAGLQHTYGLSLYLNGQHDEALSVLRRASELAPQNADYLLVVALLYERLGNFDAALAEVDRLIEMQPNDLRFQAVRQRILSQLQE